MNVWEPDKLLLFIVFVIPGFVSIKVAGLLSPSESRQSSTQVIDAVSYSCFNYAVWSWAIYLIETNELRTIYPLACSAFYLLLLLVSPVALAYGWTRLRSTQLFQAKAPHPIGKPWDYVFGQRKWYWIIVTLKDGTKIAGKYGQNSFTSSSPEKEMVAQPLRVVGGEGHRELFQKIFLPRTHQVEIVTVHVREGINGWSSEVARGMLLPIDAACLEKLVIRAGFSRVVMRGDYSGAPFDGEASWDLILTAVRT